MKRTLLRVSALLMALLLLTLGAVSCAARPKTLLSLEKDGIKVSISANIYERMLSRMKGNLCFYGYTVGGVTADHADFWKYTDQFDGVNTQTLDEYYRATILENCRTYLVALYLFEKEGLSLSESEKEEVEELMYELLLTDGDGSKTKLNAVLSAYGVNYDILKEAYTIEAKVNALQNHLYGQDGALVGDALKTAYMEENYVHFRQILLASYHYVYETDKNGDVIYYETDSANKTHICYDSGNGVPDERNGEAVKDSNGDVIYYVPDSDYTKIAYDEIHGAPVNLTEEDGTSKIESMNEEELADLKTRAEALYDNLKDASAADFELAIEEESEDSAEVSEYDDGYYLRKDLDYTASGDEYLYLEQIVEALDTMEVGEVTMVQSNFGYHIVKKYAHSEKAYESEVNETWFEDFNENLVQSLFLEKCREYFDDIKIDEAVLAATPTMKEVGINYYY